MIFTEHRVVYLLVMVQGGGRSLPAAELEPGEEVVVRGGAEPLKISNVAGHLPVLPGPSAHQDSPQVGVQVVLLLRPAPRGALGVLQIGNLLLDDLEQRESLS